MSGTSSTVSRGRGKPQATRNDDDIDGEVKGAVDEMLHRGPSRHVSTGAHNTVPFERPRRQHSLVPSLISAGSTVVRDAAPASVGCGSASLDHAPPEARPHDAAVFGDACSPFV